MCLQNSDYVIEKLVYIHVGISLRMIFEVKIFCIRLLLRVKKISLKIYKLN